MSYNYELEAESETENVIVGRSILEAGLTFDEITSKFKEELDANIVSIMTEELLKQGISVTSVTLLESYVWYRNTIPDPRIPVEDNFYRLYAKYKVSITTTTPIESSPLDPVTWAIIIKVLSVVLGFVAKIVIAYFVIKAIENWLISMTTVRTRITLPDGTIEDKWTPYLPSLAGVGIIAIIILLILLFWFIGRPKGKG